MRALSLSNVAIYVLLTSIIILIIWRLTGYQPLQRLQIEPSTTAVTFEPAAYALLNLTQNHLLYFNRQTGYITQSDPTGTTDQTVDNRNFQDILIATRGPQTNTLVLVASTGPNRANLYLLTASTTVTLTQLTRDDNGFLPTFAVMANSLISWSPNGTQIAFTAFENDRSDLFLVDTAGKQVSRLTYQQANISSILWLDDDTISFVWDWNGQDSIYKIDNDGGNLMRIK